MSTPGNEWQDHLGPLLPYIWGIITFVGGISTRGKINDRAVEKLTQVTEKLSKNDAEHEKDIAQHDTEIAGLLSKINEVKAEMRQDIKEARDKAEDAARSAANLRGVNDGRRRYPGNKD